MTSLKEQFGEISRKYDSQREQLIPCFHDFYNACLPLVKALPDASKVLDLGAGTGLFSFLLYQQRPELCFTLLDLSEDMLQIAKERFKGMDGVSFQVSDLMIDKLPQGFDIVISALAIHHLEDLEKVILYGKVFELLNPGGLFINADQVLGRTAGFDAFYKINWRETVLSSSLDEEAIHKAFKRTELDKFGKLETQLRMLENAGFYDVDVIYKNLNFVVMAASKGELMY